MLDEYPSFVLNNLILIYLPCAEIAFTRNHGPSSPQMPSTYKHQGKDATAVSNCGRPIQLWRQGIVGLKSMRLHEAKVLEKDKSFSSEP